MPIIIFILILLTSNTCFAMRSFNRTTGTPSTSATRYIGYYGAISATESDTQNMVPADIVVEGFTASSTTAPDNGGGTQSYTITLRVDGVGSTASCVMSEADTSCTSSAQVAVSAGSLLSFSIVPSGTPASLSLRISSLLNSKSGGPSVVLSASGTSSASTTANDNYGISGAYTFGQTYGWLSRVPTSGTYKNLYIKLKVAPGAGKSRSFVLMKNSVATTLTCTVSDTDTTCSDTSNTVSVVQGDTVSVRTTPSGTPAASGVYSGLAFLPTIDGESVYMSAGPYETPSASVTSYVGINGQQGGYSTTESGALYNPGVTMIARKMYFHQPEFAPGSGKSITQKLRVDGADSTLTCTISGSSTKTCADNTHSVEISSNLLNFSYVPSGTPTTDGTHQRSIVLYIDPNEKLYGGELYGSTIN